MKSYRYKKIDAFTSNGSLGNPAACIYLDQNDALSAEEMLTIAKQHKGFVSEMVYCSHSSKADVKLTYYSSECEVDFCGHGTIACLYDLVKDTPRLRMKKEIAIETNQKGMLTVYNEIGRENSVFISAPDAIHIGTDLSIAEAADALGLSTASISGEYPLDLINAGLSTLIVPITNLQDEIQTFPNEQGLKAFCLAHSIDIVLIYSLEVAEGTNQAHTRVFAPKFGYLEDPATGSGNSAFGYYLLKNKLWTGRDISIEQGGTDRVFNTVKLRAKEGKVLFGGSATLRISGDYFL